MRFIGELVLEEVPLEGDSIKQQRVHKGELAQKDAEIYLVEQERESLRDGYNKFRETIVGLRAELVSSRALLVKFAEDGLSNGENFKDELLGAHEACAQMLRERDAAVLERDDLRASNERIKACAEQWQGMYIDAFDTLNATQRRDELFAQVSAAREALQDSPISIINIK